MNRTASLFFAVLLVFLLAVMLAHSQDDMTHVDNSVYTNPQRSPSVFNHEEHNELAGIEECNECHHVYEDGKKLEDESSEDLLCSECHDFENSGNTPNLTKAFHTNCKGCHQQQKKGPIMCGECHLRE